MDAIETDVLIIGGGAAGIRASIAASEQGINVLMIVNGELTECGSTFSSFSGGWGMQALTGPERTSQNLDDFYNEIINVGLGACDSELVRILVEESGERFDDLVTFGLKFKRDDNGVHLRVKGCFSEYERAYLTENSQNISQTFLSIIKRYSPEIIRGYVIDLMVSDNRCFGAIALTGKGDLVRICAKSTVLASGGGVAIFKNHFVSDNEIGAGYAIADRAGAKLINLEYIQFMLGLKTADKFSFLPLNELKAGGVLVNSDGADVIKDTVDNEEIAGKAIDERIKHCPFSCRDSSVYVDLAVARNQIKGDKVFLSKGENVDDSMEVAHFAHAFNGGIRINSKAESSVAGLFAAGEVAAGPHGADRIGGGMMTATQVFGKRAGFFAADSAKKTVNDSWPEIKYDKLYELKKLQRNHCRHHQVNDLTVAVRETLTKHAMVIRTGKGLGLCLNELNSYEKKLEEMESGSAINLYHFVKLNDTIQTAKLMAKSAMDNKTPSGSHYREDYNANEII